MRTRFLVALSSVLFLLPAAAFALEGIGPRVTVTGTVQEVQISEKQKFDGEGGQFIIKATNGQLVTVVFAKTTQITSEGRLSRKLLIPTNITVGMQVRARGWRVDANTITASLFIIQNIELNPVLSMNGVLQKIDGGSITVLSQDGQTRNFSITNETEVNVNYTLHGSDGMNLIGKQVLLTLNPQDATLVRVIRITGATEQIREKPNSIQLKTRE
jgi:hypothetical protein